MFLVSATVAAIVGCPAWGLRAVLWRTHPLFHRMLCITTRFGLVDCHAGARPPRTDGFSFDPVTRTHEWNVHPVRIDFSRPVRRSIADCAGDTRPVGGRRVRRALAGFRPHAPVALGIAIYRPVTVPSACMTVALDRKGRGPQSYSEFVRAVRVRSRVLCSV